MWVWISIGAIKILPAVFVLFLKPEKKLHALTSIEAMLNAVNIELYFKDNFI